MIKSRYTAEPMANFVLPHVKKEQEQAAALIRDVEVKNIVRIVGVGGAGCNTVSRITKIFGDNVDFISTDTDSKSLSKRQAKNVILLGKNCLKGLDAVRIPDYGRMAAEESSEEIKKALAGSKVVFLIAGLGGGTGSGSTPVIAEIVKSLNIQVISILFTPFEFEGPVLKSDADKARKLISKFSDEVKVLPNEKLNHLKDPTLDLSGCFNVLEGWVVKEIKRVVKNLNIG